MVHIKKKNLKIKRFCVNSACNYVFCTKIEAQKDHFWPLLV